MNAAQLEDIALILERISGTPNGWKPNVIQEKLLKEGSYQHGRENMLRSVNQLLLRTLNDESVLRDLQRRHGSQTVVVEWRMFDLMILSLKAQVATLETHPMVAD